MILQQQIASCFLCVDKHLQSWRNRPQALLPHVAFVVFSKFLGSMQLLKWEAVAAAKVKISYRGRICWPCKSVFVGAGVHFAMSEFCSCNLHGWVGVRYLETVQLTNRADSALDCTVAVYKPWEQQRHGFSHCIIRPSWQQRWNFRYLDPKCMVRNTVSVLLTWQSCLCDGFLAKPCSQPDNRELFS